MVFFSVVIPTFNRGSFIARSLDSVLKQSFRDYEIIVIDDGSTDNTHQILSAYETSIQIYDQQNKGAGAARNLGIQKTKGTYIAFLDSDDVWFPWTLMTYHQIIQDSGFPAFLGGNATFFSEDKELASIPMIATECRNFPDYLASSDQSLWLGTCSVTIRSDVLYRTGGFANRNINAEDSDLWLRLGIEQGFVFIDSPQLFGYRQHRDSAISNREKTYQGIDYLLKQEKNGCYPGGMERRQERCRILTRHVRPVSLACLHQGCIHKGWHLYKETFQWHLQLMRFRYLLVFPILAVCSLLFEKSSWKNLRLRTHQSP